MATDMRLTYRIAKSNVIHSPRNLFSLGQMRLASRCSRPAAIDQLAVLDQSLELAKVEALRRRDYLVQNVTPSSRYSE
jgi:hypothetical protein